MKTAYLSDAFASGERYGLGRYASELCTELESIGVEVTPYCTRSDASNERVTKLPWGRKVHSFLWATMGRPKFERWAPNVDIVHSVEMGYPVATEKPWVVTIHDLGPLTHPEYFAKSRPWLIGKALDAATQRADAIIAVSQATAEAIEKSSTATLGDRLHVIHEGVSESFTKPADASILDTIDQMPSNAPYLLWTGSLSPRKNLANVIRAFEQIANDFPHHLVLTGKLHWEFDATLRNIQDSPFQERIHRVGFVDDKQLRALYQNAAAYVYVSLMEGFGLPILEAMASGCPVVCSNLSSMPEVAGKAGILVDPTDVPAIAEGIATSIDDTQARQQLTEAGHKRASQFTWAGCAQQVAQIYQDVLR